MAVTLAFHFPAGRYHATPWGHHVNEGLIEWPPSPWRLLRALISVGYTSGIWNGRRLPSVARRLVEKLAAELPSYHLPPAVGAHSRHYMPTAVLDGKKVEKTTLVFDTWGRVEDKELTVTWNDVNLSQEESAILDFLVERLGYLGRSESWIMGRVIGQGEVAPESNCFPEQMGASPGLGWEQVAMLAAVDAHDFENWRMDRPQDRKRAADSFPVDLLDCLQKDTNWLRRYGWSQPPGSRRVFYWRRTDAIEVGAPKATRRMQSADPVQAMLLSLTNASRNDHALPPVTRTLPQAELLHKALVGIAAKKGAVPSVLTGRDKDSRPLKGAHKHAHVIPLDLDDDGHLDHIIIWARMGLDADAQAAIRDARKTFTKGGVDPLRLAVSATGSLTDLERLPGSLGDQMGRLLGARNACVWETLTPFVPPRYVKVRGKNSLTEQVRAELRSRNLPEPKSVHQLAPNPRSSRFIRLVEEASGANPKDHNPRWSRMRHFVLARRDRPEPPICCGFAIRIEFDRPIRGPLALGYASHFGLGLFRCQ